MIHVNEASPAPAAERRTSLPGNVIRGALIGIVETVPGVSGGTVALVVGIYHQLIRSASAIVTAGRTLITGPTRTDEARTRGAAAKAHLGEVHWKIILPVMVGMVLAVFTFAGPMADAVENHPTATRAAFFGMVLASIAVPLRMALTDLGGAGRMRAKHIGVVLLAALVTFGLVSLPATTMEASPVVVLPAAMIAVSALVLPGLSGSFLLYTFGLYEPTLRAVDERDIGYLAVFALGMALGLIIVVKALRWLLTHHHTVTMLALTGVMIGALRTLWPWQDEESGALHSPGDDLGLVLGLGAAGFVVVLILVIVDARLTRKQAAEQA